MAQETRLDPECFLRHHYHMNTHSATSQRYAVLGASPNPERYSNMAVRALRDAGFTVVPIHPLHETIEGIPAVRSLTEAGPIHTLTLYVGTRHLDPLIDTIIAARPGRVIFNPGTENNELAARLKDAGIPYIYGCTIVMAKTGNLST
jgi:uncharacterized protein